MDHLTPDEIRKQHEKLGLIVSWVPTITIVLLFYFGIKFGGAFSTKPMLFLGVIIGIIAFYRIIIRIYKSIASIHSV